LTSDTLANYGTLLAKDVRLYVVVVYAECNFCFDGNFLERLVYEA